MEGRDKAGKVTEAGRLPNLVRARRECDTHAGGLLSLVGARAWKAGRGHLGGRPADVI